METNTVLQTLSTFSLQLYLCHIIVYRVAHDATRLTIGRLETHLMFLVVYGACYLFYVYVQPLLDRGVRALGDAVARPRCATPQIPPTPDVAVVAL
jgi:peptidoglycan/LPS O-acetylase OafA/YrhL